MNEFGWYRNCKDCNNLIKKGVPPSCKICAPGQKSPNDDYRCAYFKRKWWKLWIPG